MLVYVCTLILICFLSTGLIPVSTPTTSLAPNIRLTETAPGQHGDSDLLKSFYSDI